MDAPLHSLDPSTCHDDEQTHFLDRLACRSRSFAGVLARHGRDHVAGEGAQRRAGAWPVRRRLVLDRGHCALAGRRAQCDVGAKSADHAAGSGRLGAALLDRQDGPTVLVGHSFSGMIVTEAGVHPNVSALVYVAARAPDADEDYTALAKTYPTPPASAGIVFDGDEGRLSEEAFLRDFAGDLPEAKAKVLYAVQQPFHKQLLAGKVSHAAWRSKPSYYAVSTEDRTINPDLERFMAKRMGATTIEVKASHLALISQPDAIARLILDAAGQSK
ncbi:alpha/beta hydrolase [Bradyrhizobium septentrionale]|uniref:Alpha/beta hydrolase n=1 Tax=Bradyrhizobium septentrionale TaxID=1404411 RepID=A0ABZ2NUW1_9BRAD